MARTALAVVLVLAVAGAAFANGDAAKSHTIVLGKANKCTPVCTNVCTPKVACVDVQVMTEVKEPQFALTKSCKNVTVPKTNIECKDVVTEIPVKTCKPVCEKVQLTLSAQATVTKDPLVMPVAPKIAHPKGLGRRLQQLFKISFGEGSTSATEAEQEESDDTSIGFPLTLPSLPCEYRTPFVLPIFSGCTGRRLMSAIASKASSLALPSLPLPAHVTCKDVCVTSTKTVTTKACKPVVTYSTVESCTPVPVMNWVTKQVATKQPKCSVSHSCAKVCTPCVSAPMVSLTVTEPTIQKYELTKPEVIVAPKAAVAPVVVAKKSG